VTAYDESRRGGCQWIMECLKAAQDNPHVDEIIVVNDGTPDWAYLACELAPIQKLRFVQNPARLHVFGNKLESVWQATSDWCLMCDSDNIMDRNYYDILAEQQPWEDDCWYCASKANPTFDYRKFIGTWDRQTILDIVARDASMYWCFVNTGNQFIHRKTFLDIFGKYRGKRFDLEQPDYFKAENRQDEKWFLAYGAQDSFFFMKEWLVAGNRVKCVDGLEYDHRIKTGDRSNYERGPIEKCYLAPAYYLELIDAVNGEKHDYTFLSLSRSIAQYIREDNKIVMLNMATGAAVFK
jgi:glycosyltransferase involved in cell wall biosynthesis